MTSTPDLFAAQACVLSGEPPVLVICSVSADSLTSYSREFVRELRSKGARVEFHAPGEADAILQSVNRLLTDIPLESMLSSTKRYPPHLLIVDDAEKLSMVEASALRRVVQGLRGSAFRTVLLVKQLSSGLRRLPVAELADLSRVWDVDGPPEIEESAVDEVEQEVVSPSVSMMPLVSSSDTAMPDVLTELARERAETRGFDVTLSRRWMTAPLKAAGAVIALLLVGYGVQALLISPAKAAPLVYDCGLHADRASVDVLLGRIGRTTPTTVTKESGRFRLRVGPFTSEFAASAAGVQVWRLGACRLQPISMRKVGG